MYFAFVILCRLDMNRNLCLAAVLIVFSGYYFMTYKSMVSVIGIGLLGFLLTIYTISAYSHKQGSLIFYLLILTGLSMGEAYPALFVILTWFIFDMASVFFMRYKEIFTKSVFSLKNLQQGFCFLAKKRSFHTLSLAIIFVILHISLCIWSEIKLNQMDLSDWKKTSVYNSMMRRATPISPYDQDPSFKEAIAWNDFIRSELKRIAVNLAHPFIHPFGIRNLAISLTGLASHVKYIICILFSLLLFFLIYKLCKQWNKQQRILACITIVSPFLFLFTMKRATAYHDFMAIYYASFCFLLMGLLFYYIPARASLLVLLFSFYMFIFNTIRYGRIAEQKIELKANQQFRDFENIDKLLPKETKIYYSEKEGERTPLPNILDIPRIYFLLGFFIREHYLTESREHAKYIISTKPQYNPFGLTPKNHSIFLFENK